MTYCVALRLHHGLVFMSDSRTNAGVDNFASTRKMFTFCTPGERTITIMTAGNLATTQAMISLLNERTSAADDRNLGILNQPTMFQVARLVGSTLREVISSSSVEGQQTADAFSASVIVGGQIKGGKPTVFLVYPEGNFIEVSDDTPFFQIGETKYGKPILVRAFEPDMATEDALKLLLVSFDSTIKSNLSVAPPFDISVYENDSFADKEISRVEADDPVFRTISSKWGEALKDALDGLPTYKI
ncbi:peptidase [Gymnodinialimonas ceratoperidinii]|uniref:Peptidase n=1 Tax=Gymnodinialimonas ceratoperidinii TaxID=2856823 RepID=A0A8F6TZ33_9RHOB|nr:peptidase [Gymnodinialimonas ceratoperidinii]QXT40634.1 peptidase [Gymnodinialimonas ceratoperidinii]